LNFANAINKNIIFRIKQRGAEKIIMIFSAPLCFLHSSIFKIYMLHQIFFCLPLQYLEKGFIITVLSAVKTVRRIMEKL